MEKNIIDFFKKVLRERKDHLSMNSFTGHLAELSQRERKYIKKTGLEKLIKRYPETFVICEEDIYLMKEQENSDGAGSNSESEQKMASVAPGKEMVLKDMENDPCTVCSDKVDIYAVGRCQHPICYRCSTKLRVLCENRNCPVCRQKLDMVVFSDQLLPLEEHNLDSYILDKKHGIAFASKVVYEKKMILLQHVCKLCPSNTEFDSFEQLENHTKSKHQRFYCDICVRQCKIFTSERKTYRSSELKKHQNSDGEMGGHPLCKFCNTRYLDKDELLRHLRMNHCSCFICDEENDGRQNFQFYINLVELNEHYVEKHLVCDDPICMEEMAYTAVFKNDIDLQAHKVQKHLGNKSKLEKKQKQILNLPNMFEREKKEAAPQIILKVVPDAAGGIQCTGRVIGRIEEKYSFIERDDKQNQFEENIFFDLESYGLKMDENLQDYFKPFERVRVYALPGAQNCRSKWKAQKVEKLGEYVFSNVTEIEGIKDFPLGYRSLVLSTPDSLENNEQFPALANRIPASSITASKPAQLGGWSQATSKNVGSRAISSSQSKKDVQAMKAKYEVGYVHRNLNDSYGFITKENNEFLDNVYFNAENYRVGMGISKLIPDLRKVLNVGEKVCYTLQNGPIYKNVKAKFKAERVWKFSHAPQHPTNIATIEADIKKIVGIENPVKSIPSRPKLKMKASEAPVPNQTNGVPTPSHDLLALKYKQKIKYVTEENQKVKLPNDENLSASLPEIGNQILYADTIPEAKQIYVDAVPVGSDKKFEPLQIASLLLGEDGTQANSQSTFSGDGLGTIDNNWDEEYQSSEVDSSDVYSSDEESEENSWKIEENNCQCQIKDFGYKKYEQIVETCLKNKGLTKLLLKRIAEEMKNKHSNQPCNLQFIEFHKENSEAYILFYVMDKSGLAQRVVSSIYTKLNGDYPLESSWLGEMKSAQMITKTGRDLYHVLGSGHYLMVARNKNDKVSKVTLHYRPLPDTHTKIL